MAAAVGIGLTGCGDDGQTTSDSGGSSTTATTGAVSTTTESPTTEPVTTGPVTTESPTTGPAPVCGDGNADPGEECDDGNADDTDTCTSACKNAVCGDGFVQAGAEECDDANTDDTDACTNACKNAVCGDGIVGPGEACDDGNMDDTDTCTNACAPASCGDGVVQPGIEECDDANMDDTDACLNSCKNATCGDGFVQAGVEECDDANMDDTDACVTGCKNAACGDGFLQAGVEECDDGNMDDTDACVGACKNAVCGDGFVQAGTETCDDGNMANNDMCTTLCKAPACDDMLQSGTESDVDCGGMCMTKCADGKMCNGGADCASGYCSMNKCAVAISCQQIKQGNAMAPNGVYTIDPDGGGMGAPLKVYCDMTTDGGGWTMVYKISSGVAGNANTLWTGAALNENDMTLLDVQKAAKHYVSGYITNYWNKGGVTVTDVRAHVYKAGAIQKFWKFDGKMSTSISWFTNTKLISSSYMDLPAGPFNYFAILGDNANGRNWFINRQYGGCGVDAGWLVLDTTPDPCTWESNNNKVSPLRIVYAAGQTFASWQSAADNNQLGVADAYAVFVR